MKFELFYLLPLTAGFLYALSALFIKRASSSNVGLTRTLCLSNWMMGLLFSGVFFFQEAPVNWQLWYAPLIAGVGFFVAQVFTFLAIRAGDVSVITPIMGAKVIFVAITASIVTTEPPPPLVIAGAVLSAVAILFLGLGDIRTNRGTLPAILWALASAAAFGATDGLVQKWGRAMGSQVFIGSMFLTVALLSFFLIPLFKGRLRDIEGWAWPWLLTGCAILAVQAMLLGLAMSIWGQATAMNTLYSSRGIWSILLVLLIGQWFANRERDAGRRVMAMRMIGALLLTGAIVLVLRA